MFRKTRAARPSYREQLERSQASSNFYADMAGKPRMQNQLLAEMKPKRTRAPSDPADTEAPVVAAVGELLSQHPAVLLAVRQNSGAMHYQGANGRAVPVWFYKLVRKPGDVTFTDYWGFLRDRRPFAIECKRPSWRGVSSEREQRQQAFIDMVKTLGGIGGFVRSTEETMGIFRT